MMNYCTLCGHKLVRKIPPGDSLERFVCASCQEVHYQNPRVITGCIAHWQRKILLCRRAIEPHTGSWTLPAGYMENDETMEQGALREAREETGANISLDTLKGFKSETMDYTVRELEGTDYGDIAIKGAQHLTSDSSFSSFERNRDLYFLDYFDNFKYSTSNLEKIFQFFLKKKIELGNINILFTGVLYNAGRSNIKCKID